MLINVMKSKIHRVTVTDANLDYTGSVTIDKELMIAADIIENEKVQIVNINNGNRFETYAIADESRSGVVCLNGAAARQAHPGDVIIIITYAMMPKEEAILFRPSIVLVDKNNQIIE
jgi:aspartate 1-decarboxylase